MQNNLHHLLLHLFFFSFNDYSLMKEGISPSKQKRIASDMSPMFDDILSCLSQEDIEYLRVMRGVHDTLEEERKMNNRLARSRVGSFLKAMNEV